MSFEAKCRWRLNPACRLKWRTWGNEYILYNAASGQTHLLNDVGTSALGLLGAGELSVRDLGLALSVQCDLPYDTEFQAYVEAMLRSMDSLGLIEPVLHETG